MEIGFVFWLLMLIWIVFGFMWNWPGSPASAYGPIGNMFLLFCLFFLLGWKVFGFMIHG